MVLTLGSDLRLTIYWCVDAAFGVHHNYRSHTGAAMSLGKGTIYRSFNNKKLNTRRSTKAKLVAVNDLLP